MEGIIQLLFYYSALLTGLALLRFQTRLCLRQHGTLHCIVVRFSLAERKNEQQKEEKVPP